MPESAAGPPSLQKRDRDRDRVKGKRVWLREKQTIASGVVQREGGPSRRPRTSCALGPTFQRKTKKTMSPPEAASEGLMRGVDEEPLSTEAVQKKSIRELTLRSVKRTYEMFDGHHTIRPPMHEARCAARVTSFSSSPPRVLFFLPSPYFPVPLFFLLPKTQTIEFSVPPSPPPPPPLHFVYAARS